VNAYARSYNRYPLPHDTVTFSGEAVVAVVAATRYLAEDMAEAVQVDYAPLPAVLDVEHSLAADAPRIHPELSDNILFYRRFGEGEVDHAFAAAELVFDQTFTFPSSTVSEQSLLSMQWCQQVTLFPMIQARKLSALHTPGLFMQQT
jgi:CO/xanthine dehydrogenase Mo-binding subunit